MASKAEPMMNNASNIGSYQTIQLPGTTADQKRPRAGSEDRRRCRHSPEHKHTHTHIHTTERRERLVTKHQHNTRRHLYLRPSQACACRAFADGPSPHALLFSPKPPEATRSTPGGKAAAKNTHQHALNSKDPRTNTHGAMLSKTGNVFIQRARKKT